MKIVVNALPTAREMERYLDSLANDTDSNFRRALDFDVSHVDVRADAYNIRVTHVSMDEETIDVSYEVDYSIYNGCKDMDVDDSEERLVSGVRTIDGWAFDEFVPLPKRTTVDEF